MQIKISIVLLLWLSTFPVFSQTSINWKTLAKIKFVEKYVEAESTYEYLPEFSATLEALHGKEISIKGFMLPIEPENDIYLLSQNPLSSCFFCGGGGPESVIELNLKPGHPTFRMDQVVTIRGTLRLNKDDFEHMMYILDEAALSEDSEP